jgi:hypothetical protein
VPHQHRRMAFDNDDFLWPQLDLVTSVVCMIRPSLPQLLAMRLLSCRMVSDSDRLSNMCGSRSVAMSSYDKDDKVARAALKLFSWSDNIAATSAESTFENSASNCCCGVIASSCRSSRPPLPFFCLGALT